jgi:hypothetical protein
VPDNYYYLLDAALQGNLLYVVAANSYSSPNMGALSVVDMGDPADPAVLSTTPLFLAAASPLWDPDAQQYRYSHAELAVEHGRVYVSHAVSHAQPQGHEPNDTPASAEELGDLSRPARVRGAIFPANDKDYYHLAADKGSVIAVAMRAAGAGVGSLGDTYVELRDSTDAIIVSDNDGGAGADSLIAGFTLPRTGDYYARARAYSPSATGTYELVVAIQTGMYSRRLPR